jgi:hypothetical protein
MARSRNNCCHENATIRLMFIVGGVYVAVSDIKMFSVPMVMQQ